MKRYLLSQVILTRYGIQSGGEPTQGRCRSYVDFK